MIRTPSRPLRLVAWFWLLVVGVVALPLAHALYLVRLYAGELENDEAVALERQVSASVRVTNERVQRIVSTLQALAASDPARRGDWPALHAQARRLVVTGGPLSAITLVDADGRIVFGTVVPFGSDTPPAAQPEAVRRVLDTGQPALSGPFRSPFATSPLGPRWVVAIGIPLRVGDSVTHVLRGIVPCDDLRASLAALNPPEGWLATLTDADGTLIARTLGHEQTVGRSVNPPMAEAIRSRRKGPFNVTSREGTPYRARIDFLPGNDWSIQIGVSAQALQAQRQAALRDVALFYLAVLAAIGLVGQRAARSVARRLGTVVDAARNASTDLAIAPANTGVHELDELHAHLTALSEQQRELLEDTRNQKTQLQLLYEHAPVALALFDAELRFLAVSRRWTLDTGLTDHATRGLRWFDVMPQWPEEVRLASRRALAGDAVSLPNVQLSAPDGSARWFRVEMRAWSRPDASIGGLVVFKENVTEAPRATQRLEDLSARLAQSEARFNLAMDAASEGIWDWDIPTGEVYYSPGYSTMLGYDPREAPPDLSHWSGLLDPQDAEAVVAEVERRLRDRGRYAIEYRMRHRDGSCRWILSRGRVVETDDCGAPRRAVGVHVDVTELKQARLAAEAASVAKSRFLANVSHEIRTPLNGVLGMAALIQRAGLTPAQSRHMDMLHASGRHLLEVINAVLDLAKIDSGKVELADRPLEPGALVADLRSLVGDQVARKGLELVIEDLGLPGGLRGDATRLKQACINLLGNALKFTERGRVALRIAVQDEDEASALVRFEVEDTGIGIAEEALPRLFVEFVQADDSSTRSYGGTGLGLALVRRLAGLMGGEAGATSTPGVASVFWFTARLNKGESGPSAPAPVLPSTQEPLRRLKAAFAGRRVLVVDDEPINRVLATALLNDAGLVTEMAENGQVALDSVRDRRFDLILMDLQMPVMNGPETAAAIRRTLSPTVPIIAVSANAFEQDRQQCLQAGMNDFLAKPFFPADLFAIALKWLDAPQAS